MRTKTVILTVALLASVSGPALASREPPIERIDGRGVKILTASARDGEQGLSVFGLIRRDRAGSTLPATAHLDISAFDRAGRLIVTTPTRVSGLTASQRHRDPSRYEVVLQTLTVAGVGKVQVRYQAKAHAAEGGEGVR
jgi:hypothetical protein